MVIRYNSPVVLTLALISVLVMILDQYWFSQLIERWFSLPHGSNWFSFTDLKSWTRLFGHILGHRSWDHLMGSLTIILLVGPLLEENMRKRSLVLLVLLTALITAILHMLIFGDASLNGATSVAFMMVLLGSFGRGHGGIPLTFVSVAVLFLIRELAGPQANQSELAQLIGGACGAAFGIWRR